MTKLITIIRKKNLEILNVFLLAVCFVVLFFYIITMNQLVSNEYGVTILRDELTSALEEQNEIRTSKMQSDGITQVAQFAQRNGMVEATRAVYIFEDTSFAQK